MKLKNIWVPVQRKLPKASEYYNDAVQSTALMNKKGAVFMELNLYATLITLLAVNLHYYTVDNR